MPDKENTSGGNTEQTSPKIPPPPPPPEDIPTMTKRSLDQTDLDTQVRGQGRRRPN